MENGSRIRLLRFFWLLISPTALCSLTSLLIYLGYRIRCLLSANQTFSRNQIVAQADRPQSLALAWLFLGFELLSLLPHVLPYVLRTLAIRPPKRHPPPLPGNDVPSVDVLITCCNEDVAVIRDTALAACTIDYPSTRFRVFICDDGSSVEVRDAVEDMRLLYPNIFYSSRAKDARQHFKAGNLNHGLAYSRSVFWPVAEERQYTTRPRWMDRLLLRDTSLEQKPEPRTSRLRQSLSIDASRKSSGALPDVYRTSMTTDDKACLEHCFESEYRGGGIRMEQYESFGSIVSEFVAALDADMIPEPLWLRTVVAPLVEDPRIALACPPQTFYDIPTNDPLTQTMSHFSGIAEVVNDSVGHADCLGSGYALRRSAIEGIGGYPVESLSEDVCCSASLLGAGWRTVFIHETLQYGQVPDSLYAHIKQRTRWFVGHIQTASLFKGRLSSSRGRHLTVLQRIAGLAFDFRQFVQVPLALNLLFIPFALLSGYPMVIWTNIEELQWLLRFAAVWMLCHWLHQGLMGLIAGLGNGTFESRTSSYDAELEQWLAPYIFLAFFRSFVLPRQLGGKVTAFTATGSISSSLDERDPVSRAPLIRRLRISLLNHLVIIHVIFLLATTAGVVLTIIRAFSGNTVPSAYPTHILRSWLSKAIYLVARIGWLPLLWLQYLTSCMAPVLYILFPPSQPDREALLDRDPKTGVAHPTLEARKSHTDGWIFWRYLRVCMGGPYAVATLILSFYIANAY